jgi:hypothetical protein
MAALPLDRPKRFRATLGLERNRAIDWGEMIVLVDVHSVLPGMNQLLITIKAFRFRSNGQSTKEQSVVSFFSWPD